MQTKVFYFLFFSFPSFENCRKTVLDDSFASDLTLYDSVQQNKFVEFANPSNSTIPDAPINTNFVNYQLDSKQTSFEIFDENKYGIVLFWKISIYHLLVPFQG